MKHKPTAQDEDALLKLIITEKIVRSIGDATEDLKEILTNPLGIGVYLKNLTAKDDPLAYVPILVVVGAVIYFMSVRWGNEITGYKTMLILGGLVTVLVVFRFIESLFRPKSSQ